VTLSAASPSPDVTLSGPRPRLSDSDRIASFESGPGRVYGLSKISSQVRVRAGDFRGIARRPEVPDGARGIPKGVNIRAKPANESRRHSPNSVDT
jgi:hypothetical protein